MSARRVAVVGSRDFENLSSVATFILSLPRDGSVKVVSGGARGVDRIAARTARVCGIVVDEFFPDYVRFSTRFAPLERNTTIVENADELVTFWDGRSTGTVDIMRKAHARGLRIRHFGVEWAPAQGSLLR